MVEKYCILKHIGTLVQNDLKVIIYFIILLSLFDKSFDLCASGDSNM